MTTADLLARCQTLNIRLRVEAGQLRYTAPRGALDSALRAELVAQRHTLIALLVAPTATVADPRPWNRVLITWNFEWRERWGRRANELAEAGVRLFEDEQLAFLEISAQMDKDAAPEDFTASSEPPRSGPTGSLSAHNETASGVC
jgi:hypothetical protein